MNGHRWLTKKLSVDARKVDSLSRKERNVRRKHGERWYPLDGLFTCEPHRHHVNEHEECGYTETRLCN